MKPIQVDRSDGLSGAFRTACLAELEAIKPGNVHLFADGHGMTVQDFASSAEASVPMMVRHDLSVGRRIELAMAATWDAVGCNTNLGILLLCAPLAQAALHAQGRDLRVALDAVLSGLDAEDAAAAYRAIVRAEPAGLGQHECHDVKQVPTVTLLEAMRAAQERDRIAWQYTHRYADIFDWGIAHYHAALQRWARPAWAITALYLGFLERNPDTHLVRKHGEITALWVQGEAKRHARVFAGMENPKKYQHALLEFDAQLKARGLNPGTSADLTVATLFATFLRAVPPG